MFRRLIEKEDVPKWANGGNISSRPVAPVGLDGVA